MKLESPFLLCMVPQVVSFMALMKSFKQANTNRNAAAAAADSSSSSSNTTTSSSSSNRPAMFNWSGKQSTSTQTAAAAATQQAKEQKPGAAPSQPAAPEAAAAAAAAGGVLPTANPAFLALVQQAMQVKLGFAAPAAEPHPVTNPSWPAPPFGRYGSYPAASYRGGGSERGGGFSHLGQSAGATSEACPPVRTTSGSASSSSSSSSRGGSSSREGAGGSRYLASSPRDGAKLGRGLSTAYKDVMGAHMKHFQAVSEIFCSGLLRDAEAPVAAAADAADDGSKSQRSSSSSGTGGSSSNSSGSREDLAGTSDEELQEMLMTQLANEVKAFYKVEE